MGETLPVGEGEIRGRVHGAQILGGLGRVERRAGELAVGKRDAEPPESAFQPPQVVGADLMAQTAGAGVDHDRDLVREEPEDPGPALVVDFVHDLDLHEVVPRAQRADLPQAAGDGLVGDLPDFGAPGAAVFFGQFQIFLPAVAPLDAPFGTALQHVGEFCARQLQHAAAADTGHAGLSVNGRHAADGKAVAGMPVRHTHRVIYETR